PLRHGVAVPGGSKIFQILTGRDLTAVGPQITDAMLPLEHLKDLVLCHDEFHGFVVIQQPRKTRWVALKPWCIGSNAVRGEVNIRISLGSVRDCPRHTRSVAD